MDIDVRVSQMLLAQRGAPLPQALRREMEDALESDFSSVTIHRSAFSRQANRHLGSRAFAVANRVYLGAGPVDRPLLIHELAHVAQKSLRGVPGGTDEVEAEADVATRIVMAGGHYRCRVPSRADAISCWGEGGHFYTAHFVLQAAGVPYDEAGDIAFFAQIGDEMNELDAIFQGMAYFANLSVAARTENVNRAMAAAEKATVAIHVQRGLHCLTGQSSADETNWRASLLENPSETPDAAAQGLAVHALGDSFAHRQLENPKKMYAAPLGHFMAGFETDAKIKNNKSFSDRAHAPDKMFERPDIYSDYGSELYAVARYRWNQEPLLDLETLRSCLKEIAGNEDEEEQIFAVRRLCAKHCKAIGPKYIPELKDAVDFRDFQFKARLPPNFLPAALRYAAKVGSPGTELEFAL